jgi:hypothetical protein
LGFFENLTQYCGLGFSRTVNDAYKSLYKKGDSDGILLWDDRILACLKSCSKYKGSELPNGQIHLVGFLFECCYDLAISPSRNVSQNPGFESFVGQFNGGEKVLSRVCAGIILFSILCKFLRNYGTIE